LGGSRFFAEKRPERLFDDHSLFFVVGFLAGLGGQSKGNSITFGFSQDNLGLDDGVGAVVQTGNVEAFLRLDIFADNLVDFDDLDDASFDGLGVGQDKSDGKGLGDKGNFVGLGLVFLTAVLVFSTITAITGAMTAITGCFASGDLHGFRFLGISHLGDTSIQSGVLVAIRVGAKLVLA